MRELLWIHVNHNTSCFALWEFAGKSFNHHFNTNKRRYVLSAKCGFLHLEWNLKHNRLIWVSDIAGGRLISHEEFYPCFIPASYFPRMVYLIVFFFYWRWKLQTKEWPSRRGPYASDCLIFTESGLAIDFGVLVLVYLR